MLAPPELMTTFFLMVGCYCLARLVMAAIAQPGSGERSRSSVFVVLVVAAFGVLGVGFFFWQLVKVHDMLMTQKK